ncbi:MAG: TauD/TfdA family dioxygenase [Gammaproteobacteria bacterium]|nr:TauD/TfdA family dioxygenase [Gammaproteobacteria bacterium]
MTMNQIPLTWQSPRSISDMGGAIDYISARKDEIQKALENHSAVLFRGFPLHGPAEFGRIITATGVELLDYHGIGGGGVRNSDWPSVYTTIDDIAPQARQSPHHERARNSDITKIPSKLAFYCEVPSASGGETALCLSSSIADRLKARHPRLFAKLSENRLRYCKTSFDKRYSPIGICPVCHQSHISWQEAFGTESKEEVLSHARSHGISLEFYDDDLVRKGELTVHKAISSPTGLGGRLICWTHKMNERPCSEWIEYEDGTIMHFHEQECVRRIAIEDEVRVQWRAGDFMLIDNFSAQHSKCPHRGDRRVYLTMGM